MTTEILAWKWIFDNWMCQEWNRIPDWVRIALKLNQNLGMCNGSLVTQMGAKGMREFINRINSKQVG